VATGQTWWSLPGLGNGPQELRGGLRDVGLLRPSR